MYITEIVCQRLVDPAFTGILTYGCFVWRVPLGIPTILCELCQFQLLWLYDNPEDTINKKQFSCLPCWCDISWMSFRSIWLVFILKSAWTGWVWMGDQDWLYYQSVSDGSCLNQITLLALWLWRMSDFCSARSKYLPRRLRIQSQIQYKYALTFLFTNQSQWNQ